MYVSFAKMCPIYSPRLQTVRANMNASAEDKMSDDELLGHMSCVVVQYAPTTSVSYNNLQVPDLCGYGDDKRRVGAHIGDPGGPSRGTGEAPTRDQHRPSRERAHGL